MFTSMNSTWLKSTAEVRGELMKAWHKSGIIHAHPEIKPTLNDFFFSYNRKTKGRNDHRINENGPLRAGGSVQSVVNMLYG